MANKPLLPSSPVKNPVNRMINAIGNSMKNNSGGTLDFGYDHTGTATISSAAPEGPVQSQSRDARPNSEHVITGHKMDIPTPKLPNGGY